MSLDSIVTINIDTQTTSPTRKGFGVPLVAGFHNLFADRVRFYTSLLAMLADGFTTTSAIYRAAQAIFAQNPRVTKLAVGKFDVAAVQTINLTPVVKNTHEYSVTINGTVFTFTSDGTATAAEIVNGLLAAINAGTEPMTASNAANVLHLVGDVAGDLSSVVVDYGDFAYADITPDTMDVAGALATISLADDSWYALTLVDQSAVIIANAAAYIETVKKIAIFTTADSAVLDSVDTTDIASVIKAAAYARSAVIFTRTPGKYAGAGWEGEELPNDPGSSTWKFKTLSGVPVDVYTPTQENTLTTKRANYYEEVAGVNVTQEGITGSGEFIDVTIFVDWLQARMQERLFGILVNVKKIPFTDKGIALVEGAIRAQLREGVDVGGLVDNDQLQVIVPKAADVSPADKASRTLQPITFQAELAGAVHFLIINGTLTV